MSTTYLPLTNAAAADDDDGDDDANDDHNDDYDDANDDLHDDDNDDVIGRYHGYR